MKISNFVKTILASLLSLIILSQLSCGQIVAQTSTYESFPGDPINARIYTLKNGLKVYLSVNKSEPRIQTCIAVKAGSKNDPADATGLAHYLEHLLFKGTDKYGALDYSQEKPLLDKIEALYEVYRQTTDTTERKKIYSEIDATSGEAAKYAIANEYDKLLSSIGASGTNAYTSFEQTVYINEIPSNQVDNWLKIEAERFRNPVFRIFHTELEAVYEEKNISIDRDGSRVFENMFAGLFKNHNYGLQTTIGTVEHLKNPSIRKIREYFNKNYVPNNMAIIMAGDLDPDKTIAMIENYFSSFVSKPVDAYSFNPENAISAPVVSTVNGPDAEYVQFAYRFPGAGSRDALVLEMIDYLLSNSKAGLLDLNLNQQQKVMSAGSSTYILKDYSCNIFTGRPRQGQSLEEVRDLILEQVDKIKRGEFDDDMPEAVVNNIEIETTKQYEENRDRANAMVDAFTLGQKWENYINKIQQLRTVTKQEIMETAKKYYGNNYSIVFKKTGARDVVAKVTKPAITPVEVNREAQSTFLKSIINSQVTPLSPVFLDFKKAIQFQNTTSGVPVEYVYNPDNQIFTLYYLFDMGRMHDKKLEFAIRYLNYLGTEKYTASELKKKFFKLGCSFDVSTDLDRSYVYLSGLSRNFKQALALFEEVLSTAKPDQAPLDNYIKDALKARTDAKLNKNAIRGGMQSYAMYGPKNPFNDKLTEDQIKALKAEELTEMIHDLTSYQHKVMYYGPMNLLDLVVLLDDNHKVPVQLKAIPAPVVYSFPATKKNAVKFVDYDMVQAEVIWISNAGAYSPSQEPIVTLFNEYFGGGMGSIVFQTLRESKALAYSTNSRFILPSKKEVPDFTQAYIGTQADKINEAIVAMRELMTEFPVAENLFKTAQVSLKSQYETSRITKTDILFSYENALRKGIDYDIRKEIYEKSQTLGIADLEKFHKQMYSSLKYNLMVLGSNKKIDTKNLKKYGKVSVLTLQDIFGY